MRRAPYPFEVRAKACELYAQGKSSNAVGSELGVPGRTVRRWLPTTRTVAEAMRGLPKSREHARNAGVARRGKFGNPSGRKAVHNWLNKWHPRKGICTDCGADGQTGYAFLRHPEPYTRNLDDYRELCVPCHRAMDTRARREVS
jgi:hypothetical protein